MIRFHLRLAILLVLILPALPALAEKSEEEERMDMVEGVEDMRSTEEATATALRARTDKRGWIFDYGAGTSLGYTASDDNDRDRQTADSQDHSWDYDATLFGLLTSVDRNSKFYFRTKTTYTETKKNSVGIRGNDFDNPKVEMMYFERVFQGRALKHTLTLGRQFSQVGRGISFGLTADGILWQSKGRKVDASVMFLRQKPGDNNIDALSPGSGRTKRWFYGAEYKHKFKSWLAFDLYALWNADRNTEDPYSTGAGQTQKSQFNSQYYGIGFDGTVWTKMKYWSEFIQLRGKTYNAASATNLTATKVDVSAEAIDVGLRYLFGGDLSPTVYGEYAFGSGDADRSTNTTSSRGGSTFGDDSAFRSFGGLSMGHALAPSLSNIRILKVGASVKPFGRSSAARWNDMTFQTAAYSYWTDARGGPTSDPAVATSAGTTAALTDEIGDEIDATISWKIFNDVNYQFKFGYFKPGSAYAGARGSEEYFKLKVSFDL